MVLTEARLTASLFVALQRYVFRPLAPWSSLALGGTEVIATSVCSLARPSFLSLFQRASGLSLAKRLDGVFA